MPDSKGSAVRRNSFDVSVDEGTFGDYEAFGIGGDGDAVKGLSEYEIFIVQTSRGF